MVLDQWSICSRKGQEQILKSPGKSENTATPLINYHSSSLSVLHKYWHRDFCSTWNFLT